MDRRRRWAEPGRRGSGQELGGLVARLTTQPTSVSLAVSPCSVSLDKYDMVPATIAADRARST